MITSIVALVVSILALIYTVRTFWLKSGENLRFTYSTTKSIETDDTYINSITIENLKDRSIVIFAIYLKIGNNTYIQLREFDEKPLIIKPFEVYSKSYDPIILYSLGLKRAKLDHLLNDEKLSKSLVVSTTNGKYEVKSHVKKWTIHKYIFNNYLTTYVRPKKLTYNGKAYGKILNI